MVKRPYNLPQMSALVAFEAAARHVSFRSAAQELNVTPAAISHQVKALEAELRCSLFSRHHRGVALTEAGAYLLVALQRGFETMADATDQLRQRTDRAAVTIGVSTAVSSLWLTPKLARFWREHGDVSVAQIVSDSSQQPQDCDLSIHYGDISREKGACDVLFQDQVQALASPSYAEKHPAQTTADLAQLSLIHIDVNETGWVDWTRWLASAGYSGKMRPGHRVNNYVIALQAAEDDMGVVLGWTSLTHSYLDTGRLVTMLPHRMEATEVFYIKLHPNASNRAKLVYDWLLSGE
ncbi:LysR family transcriptional regulator [Marivivens donghaensis]|uniref:LysR family transcriptional regulator n=1 Tax=Marivivens donghaensis TaxID=1699413 RepID=A0ABX0W1T2_9RHOB|nr:LysR substrate-binding domain-containing protein [Marivivens donghaensis]NIY73456.1 LysR family transcriptional regulator [Marivivens donghaensis]